MLREACAESKHGFGDEIGEDFDDDEDDDDDDDDEDDGAGVSSRSLLRRPDSDPISENQEVQP